MRFDTLSRVYGYLNDVTMHAECYGGYISMDQMFKHYEDLKLPAIAYDYDNSEKWGLSLERLQHVGVYKTPKEIRFTQTSVYGKGDGYYLVVRGVENMEALKNDKYCLYRKFF